MKTENVNDLMEFCAKARENIEKAVDTIKDEPHCMIRDETGTDLHISLRRIKSVMNRFSDGWLEGED